MSRTSRFLYQLTIGIGTVLFAAFLSLQHSPAYAQEGACSALVQECTDAAKEVKLFPPQCAPLRDCKRVCRGERRECKQECRNVKRDCKAECRAKYGRGKDYRQCKRSCRSVKRECRNNCRVVKTDCKNECRVTYKTPSCLQARQDIWRSGLQTIPACAKLASCIGNNSK